ncbi:unnamed protein product [Closterium sp. NIES-54]
MARHGMAWHGTAWHGMVWHGWHGTARHGMVGTAWHGMARHGMARHGMAWTDMKQPGVVVAVVALQLDSMLASYCLRLPTCSLSSGSLLTYLHPSLPPLTPFLPAS